MTRLIDIPDHPRAVGWLRDLLHQLGEGADAVLTEVLADRDVRSLRVVGPLTEESERFCLLGPVGYVLPLRSADETPWVWYLTALGEGRDRPEYDRIEGTAPTRLAADRALCLALRELGWSPVEVPTEEQVVEDKAREEGR